MNQVYIDEIPGLRMNIKRRRAIEKQELLDIAVAPHASAEFRKELIEQAQRDIFQSAGPLILAEKKDSEGLKNLKDFLGRYQGK